MIKTIRIRVGGRPVKKTKSNRKRSNKAGGHNKLKPYNSEVGGHKK
jgi:hypothetical protein